MAPIAASAHVTLEEIGVLASYGLRNRDRVQWAASTGALDAAFVGDRVAVLAPSAPWVRIYDANDSLVATALPDGTGPGRAERTYSLFSSSGHLIVAHRHGLERGPSRSEEPHSVRSAAPRLRGAAVDVRLR